MQRMNRHFLVVEPVTGNLASADPCRSTAAPPTVARRASLSVTRGDGHLVAKMHSFAVTGPKDG
jgi:hypothetical protein